MTTTTDLPAGTLSEVAAIGEEWGFTLSDRDEREIASFTYATEQEALEARDLIEQALGAATEIWAAEPQGT
ncbi:MAG TPA: hypothetical protein VGF97_07850 [Rhizomicrobium sp.]|jgi:hypothetical protein